MYMLKFKDIPSFKFIIGKDFIVQMFWESRKNLPRPVFALISQALQNNEYIAIVMYIALLFIDI